MSPHSSCTHDIKYHFVGNCGNITLLSKQRDRAEGLQNKHACSSITIHITVPLAPLVQESVAEKYVPSQSQAIGTITGGLGGKERYFPPTEKL